MLRGKVEDIIGIRRYLERIRTSSPFEVADARRAESPEMRAVSYLPDLDDERLSRAVPLWVSADIYSKLQATALEENRPLSAVVNEALAAYSARSPEDRASAERQPEPGQSGAERPA